MVSDVADQLAVNVVVNLNNMVSGGKSPDLYFLPILVVQIFPMGLVSGFQCDVIECGSGERCIVAYHSMHFHQVNIIDK